MSKPKSYVVTASFNEGYPYFIWTVPATDGDDAIQITINSQSFKDVLGKESNPDSKTKFALHVYRVKNERTYFGES